MLFNSTAFFAFFAIVYCLYRVFPFRWQNWLLLIAGYVFYGAWDIRFLFLIAFSTTVDFWIGLLLAEGRVPGRQRVVASVFIISAAILFLNVDWRPVVTGSLPLPLSDSQVGRWAVAASVGAVLAANLVHPLIGRLSQEKRRRILLAATVGVNLGFLAVFKYFNFFIDTARPLLVALGLPSSEVFLNIVLPVGISFYTFQSLSYTIDVSRGVLPPVRRFHDFALFVAFFPPMVAGPIERARHLLPQLLNPRTIRLRQSMDGIVLILLGLFKKVAIADGLAPAVNAIYATHNPVSGADVAYATVLFAFQIFCDFSGYSDIARGVSKLLGFEIMVNFNLPYLARNPSDFWRRWHISLSSWLRDYLYISLGGNRKGAAATYANLMITMTLGGLWHGAAANYIVWGVYQGALLCAHRAATGVRRALPTGRSAIGNRAASRFSHLKTDLGTILGIGSMFAFTCYGWLLFRATSLDQILDFTAALTGLGPSVATLLPKPPLSAALGLAMLIALQVADYRAGRSESFRFWNRPLQGAVYAAMIFVLVMGTSNAPAQFIYFQF